MDWIMLAINSSLDHNKRTPHYIRMKDSIHSISLTLLLLLQLGVPVHLDHREHTLCHQKLDVIITVHFLWMTSGNINNNIIIQLTLYSYIILTPDPVQSLTPAIKD